MNRRQFLGRATAAALLLAPLAALHAAESKRPALELLKETTIGHRTLSFVRLPAGLTVDEKLALVLALRL